MSTHQQRVISNKGILFVVLLAAVAFGIIIGPIISERVFSFQDGKSVALLKVSDEGESLVSEGVISLSKGFRKVAEEFEPYVVNVRTRSLPRSRGRSSQDQGGGSMDDMLDRFFRGRQQEARSLGSGTIVNPKGFIVTNSHVVTTEDRRGRRAADRIEVMLSNGERHNAAVVGFDAQADIAVLKIDAKKPLPFAKIGNTSKMQIGDWVLAIGSPFGLEQTVTAGIVSAIGRPGDRFGGFANIFGDYVQTDAAINPGNSGGPLVNMSGQLIGINTFISTRSGSSAGVGFAIPAHVFVNAYNQLVEKGRIDRGWIGITMNLNPMTPEMAEYFGVAGNDPRGIKDGDGVIITELVNEDSEPGSEGPAARAGLKAEDVVVEIAGREIESPFDLRSAVASSPPDETLPVTVVRRGQVIDFDVKLAKRMVGSPDEPRQSYSFEEEPEAEEPPKEIGVAFDSLSRAQASQLSLAESDGRVRITDVTVGSLADEAGLRPGQVILALNGEPTYDAEDFYNAIRKLRSGQGAVLRVLQPQTQISARSIFYTSIVKP